VNTGFIDVPAKDTYTFSLNADLAAKLYIGNILVVKTDSNASEQSGSIKLMPGKHSITVDYITKAENTKLLDIEMASSGIAKSKISSSMLFKYNRPPSISLEFNAVQNYFCNFDTVAIAKASDPDGNIENIELYDNGHLVDEVSTPEFLIINYPEGEHSLIANVRDNDGAVSESNLLNFMIKTPIPLPGTINAEEYRRGKSVTIVNSTDFDGGKNLKSAHGWADYPVDIAESGVYHFKFRVPGVNGTRTITIKANNMEVGTVDVGNTGTSQPWCDVETDVSLSSGIQLLHFDFEGVISLHKIDISLLPTGIKTPSERTVLVTPNPSLVDFLIQTRNASDRIVLYDVLGNVADQQPVKEGEFKSRIGSNLHPGIYLLVVTVQDGSVQTIKLVKSR
jgi:hypothetical protein